MLDIQSEVLRQQIEHTKKAIEHLDHVCAAQAGTCKECILYISDYARSSCLKCMLRGNVQDAEENFKRLDEMKQREHDFVQMMDIIKKRSGLEGEGWSIAIERDPFMNPIAIRIRQEERASND